MSIRFIHVPTTNRSCTGRDGPTPFFFDATDTLARLRGVEDAGFDGVVIDEAAGILDNMDFAAQAAQATSTLQIVLTHAAGVLAPVLAARQIAALDALSGGRLSLRIVGDIAASETEPPASHVATFARLDEYLMLLKRLWSNPEPFEHQGPFYSVRDGYVAANRPHAGAIQIRMGGLSGTAIRVAARHADIVELEPGSPEEVRRLVERVTAAAREFGRERRIGFALPVASGPAEAAAETALRLLPYAALGITEFMVTGLESAREIELFGSRTGPLLQNSIRRRIAPEAVTPPHAVVKTLPRRT